MIFLKFLLINKHHYYYLSRWFKAYAWWHTSYRRDNFFCIEQCWWGEWLLWLRESKWLHKPSFRRKLMWISYRSTYLFIVIFSCWLHSEVSLQKVRLQNCNLSYISFAQEFCVKKKDRVEVVYMLSFFAMLVSVCQMYPFLVLTYAIACNILRCCFHHLYAKLSYMYAYFSIIIPQSCNGAEEFGIC